MTDHDHEADAEAALELVRTFATHGHSVDAMRAVLGADPIVVATALGFLTSTVTLMVRCPGCGGNVEIRHEPGASIRPPLRLLTDGGNKPVR